MKKYWFLALAPVILLSAGCSFTKNNEVSKPADNLSTQNNVCAISDVNSSLEDDNKTVLPPVSQEEKNKTFTYEDTELGIKMKYPGSCYFNKGIFQCSDFTLSVWELEAETKNSLEPEITYSNNQTQLKYTYNHKNKSYALMAWYDGENKTNLNEVIDKIAKSLIFTK